MPPPPYRVDQIGSLIRPKYLINANAASKHWLENALKTNNDRKDTDDADVRKKAKAAEHKAISEIVSEQVKRGVNPITSGEFERSVFYGGFFEAIDGMDVKFHELEKFRTDFPTNVS